MLSRYTKQVLVYFLLRIMVQVLQCKEIIATELIKYAKFVFHVYYTNIE